jgi:uncharacterized integral membrane protein
MTPLEILKYVAEKLDGSSFEPWVNILLFLLFVAAIYKVIILVLGKDITQSIRRLARLGIDSLNKSAEYAPGAEAVRKKIEPYVNFIGSLYMFLVSSLSFVIVALAYFFARQSSLPLNVHVLAIAWLIGSLIYAKINIAQATWAWHEIRQRMANHR